MNDLAIKRKQVLGAPVDDLSMEEVIVWCRRAIERKEQRVIVTFNAHSHWIMHHDDAMKQAVNHADLVLPEYGMFWASHRTGQHLESFVLGIELMRELLKDAAVKDHRVFLLGARQNVMDRLLVQLETKYPHLNICGNHHGYFGKIEESQLLEEIIDRKPDILFVAMGTPRQEIWIAEHRDELQVPVSIGVGGSFDVLAGMKADTPPWARGHGLEWIYRTIQDPRAYFKRYVTVNSWLVLQVLKENLRL